MEEEEAAAGPRGEALGLVLQRLDWGDLVAASAVCWQWRRESLQEALWTTHLNQVFARQLLEPYEAAASAADGAPAWPPPPPAGADPRALAGQLVEPPSLAEFRARHTRGLGCHGHGSRSKCAVAELFFHRVVKMLKSSSAELAPLVLRSINFGEAGEAACTKADLDHLEKLANERPCVEAVFLPEELWETADVQQNPVRLPALFRALYSYVNGQGWAHCAAVPLPDFLSLGTGFDSKVFASNRDLKGMVEAAWTEAGANRSASWGAQGPLGVNLAKPDLEVLRQVFDSESRAPGSGRTENLDENKNLYEDVLFLRLAEYSQIPGIRLCLEAGASTFRQPFLVMGNTKAMLETSKRAGACAFAQGLETDVGLLGGYRQTLGRGMDQWVNVHLLPLQLIPVVTRASLDFLLTGGTPGRGGLPFSVENGLDDVSPNHLLCFAASFVAAPKVLLVDTSTTFVYTVTTIGGPRPGPRLVRLGEFEVSTCGRRAGRSGGLTKKKPWLNEYGKRLEAGVYSFAQQEARWETGDAPYHGLSLYPNLPLAGGGGLRRGTSHGVEVTVQAVVLPQLMQPSAQGPATALTTYQVTLRLLSEEEQRALGSVAPLASCQLTSRRWVMYERQRMTADFLAVLADGEEPPSFQPVDEVVGEAVVGQFPLLRAGGESFRYRSATSSADAMDGSFFFVENSIAQPGAEFEVAVPRFLTSFLDRPEEFCY